MLKHSPPDTPLPELLQQLDRDGYVIIPSLLSPIQVRAIKDALAPYLRGEKMGRNDFEGYESERVYALMAKSPVFADLAAQVGRERVLDRTHLGWRQQRRDDHVAVFVELPQQLRQWCVVGAVVEHASVSSRAVT